MALPLPFFYGLSQTDRDRRTVSLYTQSDTRTVSLYTQSDRHRQKNRQPVHSVRQTQIDRNSQTDVRSCLLVRVK